MPHRDDVAVVAANHPDHRDATPRDIPGRLETLLTIDLPAAATHPNRAVEHQSRIRWVKPTLFNDKGSRI